MSLRVNAGDGVIADARSGRATRAIVDLDALSGNVRALKRLLLPSTDLMAVVKANGYGHGATVVARVALASGATALAVATVGEGVELRDAGLAAPILVLSAIQESEVALAVRHRLDLTVGSDELLRAIVIAARDPGVTSPVAVHVKIDTGMRRYGAAPLHAIALARSVVEQPALRLAGVSTHFASADETDETFTAEQAACLDWCLAELAHSGIRPEKVHAANSAAVLRSRRYDYDLVRVGIALYGLPPSSEISLPDGVRPIMSVESRISRVLTLEPGDTVGYGRTYRSARPERVAVVPIGYADGYPRSLSNRGWMGADGYQLPIRGRISMDQTVVGVPLGCETKIGDLVTVMASDQEGGGAPTAVAMADTLETIPYEIVTALSARVPRHYLGQFAKTREVQDHNSVH